MGKRENRLKIHTTTRVLAFLCAFAPGAGLRAQSAAENSPAQRRPQTLEGSWSGSLQAGDTAFHFVLHLVRGDRDTLVATLDSLDQGVYGIEARILKPPSGTLNFEVQSVNASYEGEVSVDHRTIVGVWRQGGASLPLTFDRQPHMSPSRTPAGAVGTAEGTWQGALETNGMRYRLQLRISHDAQGQLTASMDSIDQGINGFRATKVAQSERAVHLDLPAVRSVYDGSLNAANTVLSGTWQQSGESSSLTFKRSDQILELRRPQIPIRPYPYKEEQLAVANTTAGVSLAATLTIPPGTGPFAAAILLAGSGPLDRDETDSGHRPFLILADHLTRLGIAVLRYDKRGVGKSTGEFDQATTADFAADAEAALALLKRRREIDARRIGIIGHSEGGMIASLLASGASEASWIVILAGPATKGEETLLLQSDLITRAAGMTSDQVAKSLDFDRESYNLVRHEKDRTLLESKLQELVKTSGFGPAAPTAFVQRQIHWTSSPWFRYFLDYDPAPTLRRTQCPVLVLSGERDLQVPPKENLALAKKALEAGGNKDFEVLELPGLNHQFQHCYTGLPAESRAIEETFAPEALTTISDWILKRSRTPARTVSAAKNPRP